MTAPTVVPMTFETASTLVANLRMRLSSVLPARNLGLILTRMEVAALAVVLDEWLADGRAAEAPDASPPEAEPEPEPAVHCWHVEGADRDYGENYACCYCGTGTAVGPGAKYGPSPEPGHGPALPEVPFALPQGPCSGRAVKKDEAP